MKKIQWVKLALLTMMVACGQAGYASTSNVKIGVINSSKVLRGSPQFKAANALLREEFTPREKKLVALRKKLENENTRLKRDAAVLSKAKREKLQDSIEMDQKNLRVQQQTYYSDVKLRQQQILRKAFEGVKATVTAVAKKQHFDLVLPVNSAVYASDSVDITADVLAALKKKA